MALSAAGEQSDHAGLYSFALPVSMPNFTVSLLWHPRLDGDLAHRWVLGCLREVCAAYLPARLVQARKKGPESLRALTE